ncbi:unnamed protein product [Ceutorhynchus assimilis]|uniref:Major facilitator superfamily (MFS) profile domain-containing protein n=1 Tax=Ceutorhynchus assimilis TaxID=467358 RepID=A0A9P0DMD2_9CUCU|nr:unnamed protein product [Ceutorhynchus assimilis]
MTSLSEKSQDTKIKMSPMRKALPQILAVSVKNILLLGFGMTLGFPTILIPSLSGGNQDEKISLGQDAISWIGSVNLLCVPLGCLLSGAVTQPLGRKRAMQFVNLPFLAAWLLFHYSTESWHVFLALCMTGFSGGLLEAPVLTYVAEITEPALRGALCATSTMAVNFGIFISFFLGTFLEWRTVALVNSSVPLAGFILLIFVPESPYWLIAKGRHEEARKSLAWLRGWTVKSNIEVEYLKIKDELDKNPMLRKHRVVEILKLYLKPTFWKPYLLISLVFFFAHFGNTPITAYAIRIFNSFEVPISPYYATVSISVVQLLAVVIYVFSIKYLGKRRLVAISLTFLAILFSIAGTYSYIFDVSNLTDENHGLNSTWIPLVALILQAFFCYLGIKSLPFILVGELFTNDVRAYASGLSAGTGYVFGFVSNKIFLDLVDVFKLYGVFWFYAAVAAIGLISLHFLLPETEGWTLGEITEHYAGGKRLGNKVFKGKKGLEQASVL